MLPCAVSRMQQAAALSQERRAALDLAEMQAVQAYLRREGRDLTDIEFEMIAQTWSEHCVHKTFKALHRSCETPRRRPSQVIDNLSENLSAQRHRRDQRALGALRLCG